MNTFIAFGRTKLECEPIGSADVIRAHELDELFNAIGSPYKATTFFFLLLNKNINKNTFSHSYIKPVVFHYDRHSENFENKRRSQKLVFHIFVSI